MRVYIDDDLDSNALIGVLRQTEHKVVSPRAVGTRGVSDEEHLRYASEQGLTFLTANVRDFIGLHEEWTSHQQEHFGILIVYRENNPLRDMTFYQIAQAITQLGQSDLPLKNAAHTLNLWRRRVN